MSKFQKPKYWVIYDSWRSIVSKWIICFGILGIILMTFGSITLLSADAILREGGQVLVFALLIGCACLYVGYRLLYKIYYHVLYFKRIQKNGIEATAIIQNVKTKYYQIYLNQFRRFTFKINFNDETQQSYSIPSSLIRAQWYANQLKEGKTITIKYLKSDATKIRIIRLK